MEVKKKSSFDLSKNSILYILVGLNATLGVTLLTLWGITSPVFKPVEEKEEEVVVYVDEIPIVDIDDAPPPPPPPPDAPPPPPPPPDIITEIEESPEPEPEPEEQPEPEPQPVPQANTQLRIPDKPKGNTPPPPPPPPPKPEKTRKEEVSAREVEIMAVYPGCDKDRGVKKAANKEAKKAALIKCMQSKLRDDLNDQLDIDELIEHAQDNDKNRMAAKVDFVVDEKGNITRVNTKKGDAFMKPEAKKAMQKIAQRIAKKGGMVPAKYEDGTPVRLRFSIPVKFQLEE